MYLPNDERLLRLVRRVLFLTELNKRVPTTDTRRLLHRFCRQALDYAHAQGYNEEDCTR